MSDIPCKPQIDYPCPWAYRVIGRDPEAMVCAIDAALGTRPHTVTPSHTSRGGAYRCLNVALTVESEAVRLALYEALRRHPAIVMVL